MGGHPGPHLRRSELVTNDLLSYRQRALQLVSDPHALKTLRARLAVHRTEFPLFNTAQFTRHIEAAYFSMWERYQKGDPPAALSVRALP